MKRLSVLAAVLALFHACKNSAFVRDGEKTEKYFNRDAQVVSLKKNDTYRMYKKLLVAGTGNIPTRHFITSLSPHLIDYCKKKETECVYEFVGKSEAGLKQQLDAAVSKYRPDAVLLILHDADGGGIQTLDFDNTVYRTFHDFGGPRVNLFRDKVVIAQNLKLILQETASKQAVWLGEMFVQGDVAQKTTYVKTCDALMAELGRNHIMP